MSDFLSNGLLYSGITALGSGLTVSQDADGLTVLTASGGDWSTITNIPSTIAYTDVANVFTEDQTATSWWVSSALSLKENVKRFDDNEALKLLRETEIYSYNLKADETKAQRVGLIADWAPALLTGPERDSVDIYNSLAVAMSAIRALAARVEELEQQIQSTKE